MPCIKRFAGAKRGRSTGQQPATKSGHRPADKSRINLSFLLVVFFYRFKSDFAGWCFWRDVQATCLRCLGLYGRHLSPERNVLSAFHPASTAPKLRRVPPRPDPPVECPGFRFDRYAKCTEDLFFPDMPCMKRVYRDK